jgi:hypothetical protein
MLTHLIRLDDQLWRAAHAQAVEQGCSSVDVYIADCLRSALSPQTPASSPGNGLMAGVGHSGA